MAPRLRLALVVAGFLALATIAAVLAFAVGERTTSRAVFEGATRPPSIPPTRIDLRDERGRPVRTSELRGTPVVVTFLYTTCEETCPLQAQQIKGAFDELGEDVPAIAVAVDPPRDTPERARAFLSKQRMTGRLDFALGSRAELAPVWKAFAVQPQRENLEHTGRLVLVDPKGIQRVSFPVDQLTPERLAHDVRLLAKGY